MTSLLDVILPFAMQDVMQVALVVVCVFAGWTAWSLFLCILEPRLSNVAALSAKLAVEPDEPESPVSLVDEAFPAKATCHDGRALLEHYGVLGAAPGTWNTRQA
mmetsp:Transcript_33365/g.70916  ORF Transcript_33365/g.70916 Transcript_33365/m.70916 type:complete len:104 (+) Transcript_33365:151-462(+)